MKKIIYIFVAFYMFLTLQSCWYYPNENSEPPPPYISPYKAEIVERAILEASIQTQVAQPIIKSGKIYIKENLLFLNDVNKGFHVFNYSNPINPVKIGFIKTIGATDLVIRNENIYINQATDLVTISYNSLANTLIVKNRNKNVFPQKNAPDNSNANITQNQIIVDWVLK